MSNLDILLGRRRVTAAPSPANAITTTATAVPVASPASNYSSMDILLGRRRLNPPPPAAPAAPRPSSEDRLQQIQSEILAQNNLDPATIQDYRSDLISQETATREDVRTSEQARLDTLSQMYNPSNYQRPGVNVNVLGDASQPMHDASMLNSPATRLVAPQTLPTLDRGTLNLDGPPISNEDGELTLALDETAEAAEAARPAIRREISNTTRPSNADRYDISANGKWADEGTIGYFENLWRATTANRVPVIGTGKEAADAIGAYGAFRRMRDNDYDFENNPGQAVTQKAQDQYFVERAVLELQEESERGVSIPGRIGSATPQALQFMAEFLLTGGIAAITENTARTAATSILRRAGLSVADDFLKVGAREGFGYTAEQGLRYGLRNGLTNVAMRAPGVIAGETARTVVAGGGNIVAGQFQRMLPQDYELTPEGELLINEAGEAPATSFLKSLGDNIVQNASERSGGALGGFFGALIQKLPPGAANIIRRATQAFIPEGTTLDTMTRGGWNGILEEMGEEQVGRMMNAVLNVDDFNAPQDGNPIENMLSRVWNAHPATAADFFTEAGLIATLGAGGKAASSMETNARNRRLRQELPNMEQGEFEALAAANQNHPEVQREIQRRAGIVQPQAEFTPPESLGNEQLGSMAAGLTAGSDVDFVDNTNNIQTLQDLINDPQHPMTAETAKQAMIDHGTPDANPENMVLLGSNAVANVDQFRKSVIQLNRGADAGTVIEEVFEFNFRQLPKANAKEILDGLKLYEAANGQLSQGSELERLSHIAKSLSMIDNQGRVFGFETHRSSQAENISPVAINKLSDDGPQGKFKRFLQGLRDYFRNMVRSARTLRDQIKNNQVSKEWQQAIRLTTMAGIAKPNASQYKSNIERKRKASTPVPEQSWREWGIPTAAPHSATQDADEWNKWTDEGRGVAAGGSQTAASMQEWGAPFNSDTESWRRNEITPAQQTKEATGQPQRESQEALDAETRNYWRGIKRQNAKNTTDTAKRSAGTARKGGVISTLQTEKAEIELENIEDFDFEATDSQEMVESFSAIVMKEWAASEEAFKRSAIARATEEKHGVLGWMAKTRLGKAYKSFQKLMDGAILGIDKYVEPIHASVGKISLGAKRILVQYELNTRQAITKDLRATEGWFVGISKLNSDESTELRGIMSRANKTEINKWVSDHGLTEEFATVNHVLADIHKSYGAVGGKIGFLQNYYPQMVTDVAGLQSYLRGTDDWSRIKSLLEKEDAKRGRPRMSKAEANAYIARLNADRARKGKTHMSDKQAKAAVKRYNDKRAKPKMTMAERDEFVNALLRGYGEDKLNFSVTNATKSRVIKNITPEMAPFYGTPAESLFSYITHMRDSIEAAKLFGQGVDTESSIGAFVNELSTKETLDYKQEKRLAELFKARLNSRSPSGIIKTIRNIMYIDTIATFTTTLRQAEDLGMVYAKGGILRGLPASIINGAKSIGKVRWHTEETLLYQLGLESVMDELMLPQGSGKMLNWLLKKSGVDWADKAMKENLLQTMLQKYTREAKAGKFSHASETMLREAFGESDYVTTVADLKADKMTENVRLLLMYELMDIHPVTPSNYPQAHAEMANGKIFYALKAFALNRLQVIRHRAFGRLLHGKTAMDRAAGLLDLMAMAIPLMLSGAAVDWLIDFFQGRTTDIEDTVVDNMFKLVGLSRYSIWQARESGVTKGLFTMVAPPLRMLDNGILDINDVFTGDYQGVDMLRSWQSVPVPIVGGKTLYWWFGRGGRASTLSDRAAAISKAVAYVQAGQTSQAAAVIAAFNRAYPGATLTMATVQSAVTRAEKRATQTVEERRMAAIPRDLQGYYGK